MSEHADPKPTLNVGDRFTIDLPVHRRWWQFWKPKIVGAQAKQFVVRHVVTSD